MPVFIAKSPAPARDHDRDLEDRTPRRRFRHPIAGWGSVDMKAVKARKDAISGQSRAGVERLKSASHGR
jgi:hypothetical protein